MAYSDPVERRRLVPLTAVAIVHVAIGYAFVSGLAMKVIPWQPTITRTIAIPPETIPPEVQPDPKSAEPRPSDRPTAAPREVEVERVKTFDFDVVPIQPDLPKIPDVPTVEPTDTTRTIPADLSRAAQPRGRRAAWITNDDYPPAAIRAEEEGVVGISVAIGADGKVRACSVTRSSGHRSLDDATCRLYARRASFQPALSPDGNPVASVRDDRVVWRLP